MMKASKKYLNLEVEFSDYADLQRAFQEAWHSMKSGKEWNRFPIGSGVVQYHMERYWDDPENAMNYREEVIDGKLCIIIQSKMNKI